MGAREFGLLVGGGARSAPRPDGGKMMSYDHVWLPDDIWDSADPRAWNLLQLIVDGHDPYEAERIIAAGREES